MGQHSDRRRQPDRGGQGALHREVDDQYVRRRLGDGVWDVMEVLGAGPNICHQSRDAPGGIASSINVVVPTPSKRNELKSLLLKAFPLDLIPDEHDVMAS
jgi:hypothetical protein